MAPELEQHLRERIREGRQPREVIASMLAAGSIQSEKQAWRTLEKWSRRGEYEYGVSLDLGWLVVGGTLPPPAEPGRKRSESDEQG